MLDGRESCLAAGRSRRAKGFYDAGIYAWLDLERDRKIKRECVCVRVPIACMSTVWRELHVHGTLPRLSTKSMGSLWWAQRAWRKLNTHRGHIDGDPLGAENSAPCTYMSQYH